MKMFHIWITRRCYFASLIIDIRCILFVTRYSLRYLSLSEIIYLIHQIVVLVQSVKHIRFRSE